jgi:hypothetical protein
MPTITLEVQDSRKVVPLLEAAIHRQIAYVAIGIEKTRKCLEEFEQKYGCRLGEADKVVLPLILSSGRNGKVKQKCSGV